MKLRNKKNGKIVELQVHHIAGKCYKSLADVNKEWEDYEEPKGSALDLMILTLTNFIENEPDEDKVDLEDCKQMLEKLKAWKQLKDAGFKFRGWEADSEEEHNYAIVHCFMPSLTRKRGIWEPMSFEDIQDDLELLFGGEE